jgi:hypothetical protein
VARKAIHIIHCDRCQEEIGRAEVDAQAEPPAYYRQVTKSSESGAPLSDERQLDALCPRCKKEVDELDKRIFSNNRVRILKDEENSEKKETADA